MKRKPFTLVLTFLIALIFPLAALAQGEETLSLRLSRDFGYSSGSGDIQGNFSMKATGPDDLARVEFYIDETMIADDSEAPFRVAFTTDSYPQGIHTMAAVGYTSDGRELRSNEIRANFVSAADSQDAMKKIMIPMLGLVFGIMVISFAASFITGRKLKALPPGTPRKYGFAGGAICPRCQRPFPLRVLGMNMLAGKLDRCPYCGKWGIHRSRSLDDLRAAEAAEIERDKAEGTLPEESEEEKLRKQLDSSRYQGL